MDQALPRIILRADANQKVGHGHVIRSLALAKMLQGEFDCHFVTREPSDTIKGTIEEAKVSLHQLPLLPADNLIEETKYLITHLLHPEDIVVLDGYHFSSDYQKTIKESGVRLVCIDDLVEQYFYADGVINHAGGISSASYKTELYTQLYLGTAYTLLRPSFLAHSGFQQPANDVSAAFICFGGADPLNLTDKALDACLLSERITRIHLVVGSSYQHRTYLENKVAAITQKAAYIHTNVSAEELIDIMNKSHVALVPGSTISYEVATIGMGILTGYYVDNQRKLADFLSNSGCATNLGDFTQLSVRDIASAIDTLDKETLQQQVYAQQKYFANSQSNLLAIFRGLRQESQLQCRLANQDDLSLYFEWSNDPETRQNAINTDFIDLATHTQWFDKKLLDCSSYLYVFSYHNQPLGQVRFDQDGEYYVISFSVDKSFRGQGWASPLIRSAISRLARTLPYRPKLLAHVRETNQASIRVFERNTFREIGKEQKKGVWLKKFIKT